MEQLSKAIELIQYVYTSEDLTPRERNDLWHIDGQISDILSAAEARAERTKMTIPIKREAPDLYENTGVYERCVFCNLETKYWHYRTNNPVCKNCSKAHRVSELTNHMGNK